MRYVGVQLWSMSVKCALIEGREYIYVKYAHESAYYTLNFNLWHWHEVTLISVSTCVLMLIHYFQVSPDFTNNCDIQCMYHGTRTCKWPVIYDMNFGTDDIAQVYFVA